MVLITNGANGRRDFFIYTFAEGQQRQFRVSTLDGVREIREREFVLSDSKPNIYDSLKRYLRERHNIYLQTLTNAERTGGIRLYLSKNEFNYDSRNVEINELRQ